MKRTDSDGFIIEVRPYRETSRLLRVFSREDGVVSLIAKGISRGKQSGALTEPFSLVRVSYSLAEGSTIGNVYGIELKSTYGALRRNLMSYAIAGFWFEIIREIGKDHIEGDRVFPLTEDFMGSLSANAGFNGSEPLYFFRLIKSLGFELKFDSCLSCGGQDDVRGFDRNRGGFICRWCMSGARFPEISKELLHGVMTGLYTDKTTIAEGFRLIHSHLSFRLEKKMKSYELLSDLLK